MKINKALILILLLSLTACLGSEVHGDGVDPDAPVVSVQQALTDISLREEMITLEGKVISICQARGCWFYMRDDTGQIVVDLYPEDMRLSTRDAGKRIKASGVLMRSENQLILEATGLEVR